MGLQEDNTDSKFWAWLWKDTQIIPKLKVFVWRAIHGALPVKEVLAVRIHHIDPTCQICGRGPETIMHALFKCDFARAMWLVSDLGLGTDDLPDSFKEFISTIWQSLSADQFGNFVCLLWAVWRSRNEVIFNHTKQTPGACKAFFKTAKESCQHVQLNTGLASQTRSNTTSAAVAHLGDPAPQVSQIMCYVDGSWDQEGRAGIGVYLTQNGMLLQWLSKSVRALNSTQAEAMRYWRGPGC